MSLDQETYYQNLMAIKGRSASICAPGCSTMETNAMRRQQQIHQQQQHQQQQPPSSSSVLRERENGQLARSSGYKDDYNNSPQQQQQQQHYSNSGNNMQQIQNTTPTRPRKSGGAHRSQSARVIGNRPKVKRRERDVREYQQHLDLASSEGALRDCQESYNPFLKKVPSSGRLITSASLEMSSNSLYGTPPPPPPSNNPNPSYSNHNQHNNYTQQQQLSQQHHQFSTPPPLLSSDTPRDSPKIFRRHSGGGDRRGSDKSTPEKDKALALAAQLGNFIPTIATPESSPICTRRGGGAAGPGGISSGGGGSKPTGLPKSPQVSRSGSTRRTNSVKGPRRSTTGFLDVPDRDSNPVTPDDEDEESYRLRSFSVTPKGIVNRGDSFRRRRSRSNSLIPTPTTPEPPRNGPFTSEDGLLLPSNSCGLGGDGSFSSSNRSPMPSPKAPCRPTTAHKHASSLASSGDHDFVGNHRVAMMGARGVGKTALISQFMTTECINAYDHDRQNDVEGEETVSVMLNGEESEMTFFKMNNPKTELNRSDPPDAFVLVYSVVDRASFQRAEQELRRLQEWDFLRTKAVVLVANKIDLARSRAVSTQDGRCLAVSFRVKFVEVSVGINHNVDELLVGLLHQIRLKGTQTGNQESWCKHRGILRASVKARQMLTWLLGKEDAKFKNCENLHIL